MAKSTRKATAIGILGMHRSGTSLLTRIVNLLGAYVGEEEELMRAHSENPEGYWEHQLIYTVHERLLEALHRTWDTALPLPADWHSLPVVAPLRDELIELIQTRFTGQPIWAWKDPRTCILLPLWKDILATLNIELRCLLVVRNPLDVARSLKERDGFSIEEGFGLWLNHNLAMLHNSAGLPRAVVSYKRFLVDLEGSVASWAPRLSLRWSPDDKELRRAIREAVRTDLCHSASTLRDLTRLGCPKPVVELTRMLDTMAKSCDPENPAYEPKLVHLLETHRSLSNLYSHDFVNAQRANQGLHQRLTQQQNLLGDAQEKAQHQGQRLADLQSQWAETRQALDEVRSQRQTNERQLRAREREVAEGRAQWENVKQQLQVREQEVADAQAQIADYERELDEARTHLERMSASYSWRITSPLRLAVRWFQYARRQLIAVGRKVTPWRP